MACSLPPPAIDTSGKPASPSQPTFRYEFAGVVVGEAEGFVPARWNEPATTVSALRIRVTSSSSPGLSVGSEQTLYRAGIGADCGFRAVPLNMKSFPLGSSVLVKSNDLVSGRVDANKEDPRSALSTAIRNGSIRKATAGDVKAFRDAYLEKKYTRRNLPVPETDDALSVSGVDLGSAYVVLGAFVYPPGLVDEYRVVFFVPQGVPEPSGHIGHSATYDFSSLTVSCTLARTGGMSC